jgi:hypothetical protein
MQEAVRFLARRRADAGPAALVVGAGHSLPTLDLRRLEVRGPGGYGAVFEGARLDGRTAVRLPAVEAPGFYRVIGTDPTGATRDRDELAFAVNLDPRGSDLAPAPPSVLPPSGAAGPTGSRAARRRVELWHAVAAALLVLLLLESLLIQQRR